MAASRIKLATPRAPLEARSRVQELVDEAECLVFLGFGFWKENLDLLLERTKHAAATPAEFNQKRRADLAGDDWSSKRIFASRFKLWESVVDEVNGRVGFTGWSKRAQPEPVIRWGGMDEDLWRFVTDRSFKA